MPSNTADHMDLAAGFPHAGRDRWMHAVRQVLVRGRGDVGDDEVRRLFTRVLETPTYDDGVTLQPLYTAVDAPPAGSEGLPGFAPFTRGSAPLAPAGTWDVRQIVAVRGDGADAAGQAADELENGAVSVMLDLRHAAPSTSPFSTACSRVWCAMPRRWASAPVPARLQAAEALRALWVDQGVGDVTALASLGADPVGEHAASGGVHGPVGEALAGVAALAADVSRRHPHVRAITVDAALYHDAGASEAEQLGVALATGVEYLRALETAGLDPAAAAAQLEFRLAAGAQQFLTIAAFRAFRRLWARVGEACGLAPGARGARLHAITSRAMVTRHDPWVNLLRDTIACFSAGVAGAEVVTVEPYDILAGADAGALGRRLARNTQALLIDESGMGRVADPAGGSWYVERLTDEYAHAAWAWFQEIEAAGGMVAALDAGVVQRRIEATSEARRVNVAHRRDPITGVSEFPNIDEPVPAMPEPITAGATPIPAVVPRRYAEHFERQRARADRHEAVTGMRPAIFLACLGTPAVHTARATFAKNLFEAGGIRAVTGPAMGFGAADDIAAAFRASGAALACICSADSVYAEWGARAATEISQAGAARVFLAGRPDDGLRAAGVDEFAHVGVDALALLGRALDAAGVAP